MFPRGWLGVLGLRAPTMPGQHPFYSSVYSVFSGALCATNFLQLLAMDASARTTMKGAAKCDKHCELQNSVNQ